MNKFVLNWQEIHHAVMALAIQILASDEEYSAIIAPARGGLVPGTMLSHRLGLPLFPITWSTRDFVSKYIPQNVKDLLTGSAKRILLVEDIVDSGESVSELLHVLGWEVPRSHDIIDVAAIVENTAQSKVKVDYSHHQFDLHNYPKWIEFPWELEKYNAAI